MPPSKALLLLLLLLLLWRTVAAIASRSCSTRCISASRLRPATDRAARGDAAAASCSAENSGFRCDQLSPGAELSPGALLTALLASAAEVFTAAASLANAAVVVPGGAKRAAKRAP